MRRGEGLASKVGNPIMEIVVTRHDEASLISVKAVADVKCCAFVSIHISMDGSTYTVTTRTPKYEDMYIFP